MKGVPSSAMFGGPLILRAFSALAISSLSSYGFPLLGSPFLVVLPACSELSARLAFLLSSADSLAPALLPCWGELDGWSWARILDCSTEGFGGTDSQSEIIPPSPARFLTMSRQGSGGTAGDQAAAAAAAPHVPAAGRGAVSRLGSARGLGIPLACTEPKWLL